jgi:hypothetical protein
MAETDIEFQHFQHLAAYSVAICKECRHGVTPLWDTDQAEPNQYEARFGVRIAAETGIALGFRTPHTPRIVDFHTPRYITLQYSATFVFATKSAHLYCLNRVSQSGS